MRLLQSRIVGSCFLLLSCLKLQYSIEGAIILSPSPRAFVCRAGDRLKVTCNTTESTLRWRLTLMGMTDPVDIPITSTTTAVPENRINFSRVTVNRTSERAETPLISSLEISPINEVLNGTLNITCAEILETSPSMATTVYIIGTENGYHSNQPMVSKTEVDFRPDEIIVSLQWKHEAHNDLTILISYCISVLPMHTLNTETFITDDNNVIRANLTLAYNTPYNVSVVADFCGQTNSTTPIELNYAVSGLGYSKPSLEGESVNFTCPPKWVLTGPNSTKCMGNGEWEPDPREVMCKANCTPPLVPTGAYIIPYRSTLEGTVVTYICHKGQHLLKVTAVCSNNGLWEPNSSNKCAGVKLSQEGKIAVASSVTVFTVVSIVFFIVGFLCRHWYPRNKALRADSEISASENLTLGPLYDNILPNQHNSEVLELKQNIAYGPIQQLTSDTRTN